MMEVTKCGHLSDVVQKNWNHSRLGVLLMKIAQFGRYFPYMHARSVTIFLPLKLKQFP